MGKRESAVEKMVNRRETLDFFRGKRVLVTGHTGFKGSWLCWLLSGAGAQVTGFSLEPPTDPSLFQIAKMERRTNSLIGDIRDYGVLKEAFDRTAPEIVLHLAAQPIVRAGYREPRLTYETNVMGTVNLLECCRLSESVRSVVNVTTDKVYKNREWAWGYRENEELSGFDPYSNSKSCSELVTQCYKDSFFRGGAAVSTARAGNVIGGGDFAADRILPDCVRAAAKHETIGVRNPLSTRPYQHVLEPLFVYLMIARGQFDDPSYAGCYNVGPEGCDCVSTGELAGLFCEIWGNGASWESRAEKHAPHEANFLRLDCSLLKNAFGWEPRWHIRQAVEKTCEWSKAWLAGQPIGEIMDRQISEFLED